MKCKLTVAEVDELTAAIKELDQAIEQVRFELQIRKEREPSK